MSTPRPYGTVQYSVVLYGAECACWVHFGFTYHSAYVETCLRKVPRSGESIMLALITPTPILYIWSDTGGNLCLTCCNVCCQHCWRHPGLTPLNHDEGVDAPCAQRVTLCTQGKAGKDTSSMLAWCGAAVMAHTRHM
jgi:hypothetical protein